MEMEAAQGAKQSHGHCRRLGEKLGIDDKEMDEAENDADDASNENRSDESAEVRVKPVKLLNSFNES